MQKVHDFIKKCDIYYIATADKDQPRIRLFSTVNIFDSKLYILTGKSKQFFKEIMENPKTELCCWDNITWLRLSGELEYDDRPEAIASMLEAYPDFSRKYNGNNEDVAVLYFKNARAEFTSYKQPMNEVIEF